MPHNRDILAEVYRDYGFTALAQEIARGSFGHDGVFVRIQLQAMHLARKDMALDMFEEQEKHHVG
jgi:hypothetical protein